MVLCRETKISESGLVHNQTRVAPEDCNGDINYDDRGNLSNKISSSLFRTGGECLVKQARRHCVWLTIKSNAYVI